MLNIQQINRTLQKALNSQCFSKSVVLNELLKYLVEKSIKGEIPSEFEIACEVLGNAQSPTKEKNIRIYIYNLRKKLDDYYKKEGSVDEVIFSIPKGGYELIFRQNRKVINQAKITKLSPYILGFSFVVFVLATIVFISKDKSHLSQSYLWKDIYSSNFPVLLVLGDHYFINARNIFGNMAATRFTDINSADQFDELLEKNPEVRDNFEITEQKYISKQGPFGLYKVMSFLGGGQVDFNFRYSSNLEWEHLDATNTIYIGSYKTQYILKQIFEKLGITFIVPESKLIYTVNDSTSIYNSTNKDFLYVEYATFIHFKTKDERIVMALLCNSDIGNIATIKYISDPENLKELRSLMSNFHSGNFKVVFEVRGENQTDFKILLKRIDHINMNLDEIWP